jgi:hypothetical protein
MMIHDRTFMDFALDRFLYWAYLTILWRYKNSLYTIIKLITICTQLLYIMVKVMKELCVSTFMKLSSGSNIFSVLWSNSTPTTKVEFDLRKHIFDYLKFWTLKPEDDFMKVETCSLYSFVIYDNLVATFVNKCDICFMQTVIISYWNLDSQDASL